MYANAATTKTGELNPSILAVAAIAWAAADAVAALVRELTPWVVVCGSAEDEVGEVYRAAGRARRAAEETERATSPEEAWAAARAAWAAADTAREASDRANERIAELVIRRE